MRPSGASQFRPYIRMSYLTAYSVFWFCEVVVDCPIHGVVKSRLKLLLGFGLTLQWEILRVSQFLSQPSGKLNDQLGTPYRFRGFGRMGGFFYKGMDKIS